MNKRGVDLLQYEPSLAVGVILGSLVSMAFRRHTCGSSDGSWTSQRTY